MIEGLLVNETNVMVCLSTPEVNSVGRENLWQEVKFMDRTVIYCVHVGVAAVSNIFILV